MSHTIKHLYHIAASNDAVWKAITSIEAKKDAFFSYFHDYIEEENARILKSRERLLGFRAILAGGALLSPAERHALDLIAAEYRIPRNDLPIVDMVEELLLRVDIIPPSLALAQAATESAWGTSRFAKEGNNIFGQWCFDEGCGLIPGRRSDDASHEVRAFASVDAAVKAYYRNLNSNPTYEYFRELRAHMRLHDKLTGLPGVLRVQSSFALRTVRKTTELALDN